MKNYLTSLSIFCLAIGIVIGSWLISDGLKATRSNPMQSPKVYNKLLSQNELASYLGISVNESKKLGPIPDGTEDTSSILPYIKIGKKIYYSKAAIAQWLTNNRQVTVNN